MTLTEPARVSPVPTRTRRGRGRWLVLGFGLLAVVIASAVTYAGQYEPLVRGQGSAIYAPETSEVGPPWAKEDFISLTLKDGDEFGFLFDLLNSGHFGVTVTDVVMRFDHSHAVGRRVFMEPAPRSRPRVVDAPAPFKSFALGAGEQRAIKVLFRFRQCPDVLPAGAWDAMDSVVVKYRIFGTVQTQLVRLPFTIGYALHRERCG